MQLLAISTRLSGFYFFYYAVVGTFMPFWSLYLQKQGFDFQQIGILSSLAIITRFFAPMIWGWIADRSGKRMLLVRIATCMEACIWFAIFVLPNSFQAIAGLMLIFSFFQNAILAQFESVTLFWLGKEKTEHYGKIRKWGSVGFIVAVFGVGAVLDIISVEKLPIILLGLSLLTCYWAFIIAEPQTTRLVRQKLTPLWPVLNNRMIIAFFIIEFILLLSFAPFYSFYSNYLNLHGYSTGLIGFLWAIGVIAEILMFAKAAIFLQRMSWRFLVILCLCLTSLRWLVVGLFPEQLWLQLLVQTIHAFSFALFHVIAMKVIFQNFQADLQGRGQAIYSTMWGLGVALGSLLAGHYWSIISGEIVFVVASVVVLMAIPFTFLLPHSMGKANL
ncbi:MAG: MFS transporter [Acinetobacter sp.]